MIERYKLMKEIPMLEKGSLFDFEIETGYIYGVGLDEKPEERSEYPLRTGLSGYLWLLRTEPGFFKKIK